MSKGGSVETRSSRRTKRSVYYQRIKASQCRGKHYTKCRRKNNCKTTKSGKRRSYCRKMTNRRI